jgi:isopropylmalate/homocitrate/citramalate synthase
MGAKRVVILDTTLRDGMQGQDISYTLDDKVQIALTMDVFGIDYIEGGFPLSNRKEAEFFQRIAKAGLRHSRVAAFGSTATRTSPRCSTPRPPRWSWWANRGKPTCGRCCRPRRTRTSA